MIIAYASIVFLFIQFIYLARNKRASLSQYSFLCVESELPFGQRKSILIYDTEQF